MGFLEKLQQTMLVCRSLVGCHGGHGDQFHLVLFELKLLALCKSTIDFLAPFLKVETLEVFSYVKVM